MTNNKSLPILFENKWGVYSATHFFSIHKQTRPNPTIVFASGFRAQKEQYGWIGAVLAHHGYSVFLFTVPSKACRDPRQWSDGITSAIDYLLRSNPSPEMINPRKIGVVGHSMGGLGSLLAASEDSRITCVVGLAPAILPEIFSLPPDLWEISVPVHLQIGSNDGIVPPEKVTAYFTDLHARQKSCIVIEGGNHMRFLDKTVKIQIGEYLSRFGMLGRHLKDGRATISFTDQHTISRRGFVEWFTRYLPP